MYTPYWHSAHKHQTVFLKTAARSSGVVFIMASCFLSQKSAQLMTTLGCLPYYSGTYSLAPSLLESEKWTIINFVISHRDGFVKGYPSLWIIQKMGTGSVTLVDQTFYFNCLV